MTTMPRLSALATLHLIVFIWGFTGILGELISLDAAPLVWWRTLIATISIAAYTLWVKKSLRVGLLPFLQFGITGLVTAAHWIFFFAAIKSSNVSTALVVLSTNSFFVALVAPLISKSKFRPYELLLGVLVIAGLSLIFHFEPQYKIGIILSLASAFCAAVFSSANSVFVKKYEPTTIAFYELLTAFVGVSVYLAFSQNGLSSITMLQKSDVLWLLLLGTLATAFAFIKAIDVMKVLSPFTCAITINLEPIYTIVFALLLFGEKEYMSPQFYLGSVLLIGTLFLESFLQQKWNK